MAPGDDTEKPDDDAENQPGGPGTIGGTPVGLFGTIAVVLYLVLLGAATVDVLLTVWPDQDPPCPPVLAFAGGEQEADGGTRPARNADAGAATAARNPDGGAKSKAPPRNPDAGTMGDQKPDGGAAGVGKTAAPQDPTKQQRTCRATHLFGVPVVLSSELLLVLLVMASGMLGSLVHSLRSLGWYVGNRYLFKSWTLQYLLQPIVGALMALLFYVIVRGGLFTWNSGTGGSAVNGFGFAAIAAVIGMFSPQAAIKLKQIAETLFTPPPSGRESLPQGNGKATSAAQATTLAPKEGPAAGGTEVVITGRGFADPVAVKFGNTAATAVKRESDTSIRATTPPHAAGSVAVTVSVKGGDVGLKDPFLYR